MKKEIIITVFTTVVFAIIAEYIGYMEALLIYFFLIALYLIYES